jgi:ATP-dependent RNA helicase MSS116, mitochondrial
MGFREEIQAISRFIAPTPERQTFLFSATVSREIQQIARATLDKNHLFIDCVPVDASPVHAHVPQYHTILPSAAHQIPHILKLLAHDQLVNPGVSKTIIFLPTTRLTQLFSTLIRNLRDTCLPAGRGTRTYEIHSKRTMESRTKTSAEFRSDKGNSILISSDVSARGVDYPGVTRIIQVGIPSTSDQYVHRVGRTGRGRDKVGRADLVLLPWEIGFVTWQLTDIPLKPLTVTELDSQVKELAEQQGRGYAEVVPDIEKTVAELIAKLDPDAIKETLASLLGYYISKSGEIRCQKSVMVEGLKQWTVDAMGLERPPYISESFLERLGISDNRTKHFGRDRMMRSNVSSSRPAWAQRGNVKHNVQKIRQQHTEGGDESFRDRLERNRSSPDRDNSYGDRDRSYGGRDRPYEDRDRSHGDRERSYGGRDRSYGNRDRSFGERGRSSYGRRDDRGSSWGERDSRGESY